MVTLIIVTIRMSISLMIASIGGVFSERVGVVNIGLEGMMLTGAFLGVLGSFLTGSPWIGVIIAVAGGGLIGLLHAFLTVTLGANQPISSMGINLLGAGLTAYGVRVFFGTAGATPKVEALNKTMIFGSSNGITDFLSQFSPIVYIALIIAVIAQWMLYKTTIGLRLRSVGENPGAADALGLNVRLIKYLGVMTSGLLCGLAGAYISLGQLNLFQEGMTSGRGYMACAIVIMGKWTPVGSLLACLMFGFADAVQFKLQVMPNNPVPGDFMLIIPYVLTLVVITLFFKHVRGPESLGKFYDRNIR